jgi:hypothetical protein
MLRSGWQCAARPLKLEEHKRNAYCITQQRHNIIIILLLLKYLGTSVRLCVCGGVSGGGGRGFNNIALPHDLTSGPGFATATEKGGNCGHI